MSTMLQRTIEKAQTLQAHLNAAQAAADRVRALHQVEIMHELCDDEQCQRSHALDGYDSARVHPDVVSSRTCKHCSTSELVDAPCPTLRALDGTDRKVP